MTSKCAFRAMRVHPLHNLMTSTPNGFAALGLAPSLIRVLDKKGFTTPTPIQEQAIPLALHGNDVIGIAQTGTGKTLAFGLPMLERLVKTKGQALILLPTRELAIQVEQTLELIGDSMGLRCALLIGGAAMGLQIRLLREKPHVIIATPGRLIDHVKQRTARLDQINIVVLDEADRMFDIGFAPQIKEILQQVPSERQTLLFSATMPPEIQKLTQAYMRDPKRVEVAPQGSTVSTIEQEIMMVEKTKKISLLNHILKIQPGTVIVFTRTKFGAKRVAAAVRAMGHTGAEIHSNRSLAQRRFAMEGFKNGRLRVLVATDIAARGIDVKDIALVINYDLPDSNEDYVHRIGRTGRAGKSGKALSFVARDEKYKLRGIERLINKALPVVATPAFEEIHMAAQDAMRAAGDRGERSGGGFGGGFNRRPSNDRRESRPSRFNDAPRPERSFNSAPRGPIATHPTRFDHASAGANKRPARRDDGKAGGSSVGGFGKKRSFKRF